MATRSVCALLAFILLIVSAEGSTLAPLEQWGTSAGVSINRKSAGYSDVWSLVDVDIVGGLQTPSSQLQFDSASYNGHGFITTGLNPQARVYCWADGMYRALAEVYAAEGFTYTGDTERTVTMDLSMTGSLVESAAGEAVTFHTILQSDVFVFPAEGFRLTNQPMNLWLYEGLAPLDFTTLTIDDEVTTEVTAQLTFDAAPGDRFYVWYKLKGNAALDGSIADAWSTLDLTLDTPGEFAAASPEPATLSVLGAGAVVLLRRRR